MHILYIHDKENLRKLHIQLGTSCLGYGPKKFNE